MYTHFAVSTLKIVGTQRNNYNNQEVTNFIFQIDNDLYILEI